MNRRVFLKVCAAAAGFQALIACNGSSSGVPVGASDDEPSDSDSDNMPDSGEPDDAVTSDRRLLMENQQFSLLTESRDFLVQESV